LCLISLAFFTPKLSHRLIMNKYINIFWSMRIYIMHKTNQLIFFGNNSKEKWGEKPHSVFISKLKDQLVPPFFLFCCFIASPIWLLAVKEATILLSISLPACGEFGKRIKFEYVSSPMACRVSYCWVITIRAEAC